MTPAHPVSSLFSDLPRISTIEHHAAIGSTNDRARELAALGTPEIALVSADEQLAGRGRQGRSWYTPPSTALAFSLLIRPVIAAQQAMRLTMLTGLAVVEGIEWATGLRLDLKWPNDVVIQLTMNQAQLTRFNQDEGAAHSPRPALRKIGGILTECAFQGDVIEHAIIGIGLNVNVDFSQQRELREIATSLMHLAGCEIDRWTVLKAVVAAWVDRSAWLADAHADHLREAWAARLINLRRPLQVKLNEQVVTGYAEGVDVDGALLLRTADNRLHRLLSGDVTLHDLNR
ncbi:BirA family transcriptional regulator, biotin operon repressor / biotin---[acetyl-CoA-carboxylase] ligase [Thermoflexales bacterium]|nr:BirA family transcriptional regulator, biotin operon repressor / biotin---[acetyl-CoA-carboxylase] ligase [Thermoflexales bacterium]